jgi:hypothetical protein
MLEDFLLTFAFSWRNFKTTNKDEAKPFQRKHFDYEHFVRKFSTNTGFVKTFWATQLFARQRTMTNMIIKTIMGRMSSINN